MAKRVSLKGRGADLFFGDFVPSTESGGSGGAAEPAPDPGVAEPTTLPPAPRGAGADAATAPAKTTSPGGSQRLNPPIAKPSALPRHESKPASKLASEAGRDDRDVVETIRKVVKVPGREVSFVRLTPEEKGQLADVVYTYKRQGMKTTETEVNRIALNYLLLDYREHGEHSVLARVLAALLA